MATTAPMSTNWRQKRRLKLARIARTRMRDPLLSVLMQLVGLVLVVAQCRIAAFAMVASVMLNVLAALSAMSMQTF